MARPAKKRHATTFTGSRERNLKRVKHQNFRDHETTADHDRRIEAVIQRKRERTRQLGLAFSSNFDDSMIAISRWKHGRGLPS